MGLEPWRMQAQTSRNSARVGLIPLSAKNFFAFCSAMVILTFGGGAGILIFLLSFRVLLDGAYYIIPRSSMSNRPIPITDLRIQKVDAKAYAVKFSASSFPLVVEYLHLDV